MAQLFTVITILTILPAVTVCEETVSPLPPCPYKTKSEWFKKVFPESYDSRTFPPKPLSNSTNFPVKVNAHLFNLFDFNQFDSTLKCMISVEQMWRDKRLIQNCSLGNTSSQSLLSQDRNKIWTPRLNMWVIKAERPPAPFDPSIIWVFTGTCEA